MNIQNAVIGFPLEHTGSPRLHNAAYADLGLNAKLTAIANENIEELVDRIRKTPLELTAVTMPHKEAIMEHLDEIDEDAEAIGSVNTVINREGELHGYNTDIVGMEYALRNLQPKSVMLLGAGGAARPLARLAQKKGWQLMIWNRSPERAKALAEEFGATAVEEPQAADLLVNTTPLGMHPHEGRSPIRPEIVEWYSHVFDIVYNPYETQLLKDAKVAGAVTISGLDMFVAQGLEQIRLWSGQELDPQDYLKLFRHDQEH